MSWVIKVSGRYVINAYTGKPRVFSTSKRADSYATLSHMQNFTTQREGDGR